MRRAGAKPRFQPQGCKTTKERKSIVRECAVIDPIHLRQKPTQSRNFIIFARELREAGGHPRENELNAIDV